MDKQVTLQKRTVRTLAGDGTNSEWTPDNFKLCTWFRLCVLTSWRNTIKASSGEQVDLAKRTVRTLAGDGTKAEGDYVGGQRGAAQRLNSPWDLAFDTQVAFS